MVQFLQEHLSDDEIARLRGVFEPLAVAVRDLVDATIRTTVDEETVRTVQSQIEQATAQLRAQQIDGSYGVRITPSGLSMPWGNAVVGVRNALAPPLKIHHDREGEAWSEFHLGAAWRLQPREAERDGDAARLLLRQPVGVGAGQGAHQRGLAVVHMA